ncbi:unnamed protein product [marine sediment metagenome]|uniref:Uncharacterized protein n=1 Tax=marine sediment metagenome TaxID=412755 RepID=X1U8Q3_9ZZZZ
MGIKITKIGVTNDKISARGEFPCFFVISKKSVTYKLNLTGENQ